MTISREWTVTTISGIVMITHQEVVPITVRTNFHRLIMSPPYDIASRIYASRILLQGYMLEGYMIVEEIH